MPEYKIETVEYFFSIKLSNRYVSGTVETTPKCVYESVRDIARRCVNEFNPSESCDEHYSILSISRL